MKNQDNIFSLEFFSKKVEKYPKYGIISNI